MKKRILAEKLRNTASSKLGRLFSLTGARQVGKTTLLRKIFEKYEYISLDDPIGRSQLNRLSVPEWNQLYPQAILDEIQKSPELFDTVKGLYDQYSETRYGLSGSSQILLHEGIKETLAGRIRRFELFGLTVPETMTHSWDDSLQESLLIRLLQTQDKSLLSGVPVRSDHFASAQVAWKNHLEYGAYPFLHEEDLTAEERKEWLRDYVATYLQRDIRDLANFRDLEPFAKAKTASANLSGQMMNFNEVAKLSGISPLTAQRFVHCLEVSYQVLLLTPWFENPNKRLKKSPKIHYLDMGIMRTLTNKQGELSGHEYESAVVSEIYKQIQTYQLPVHLFHLSTFDDREVDLLIDLGQMFIAIEIKKTEKATRKDARHLVGLENILNKPILAKIVLSEDREVKILTDDVINVPTAYFVS